MHVGAPVPLPYSATHTNTNEETSSLPTDAVYFESLSVNIRVIVMVITMLMRQAK